MNKYLITRKKEYLDSDDWKASESVDDLYIIAKSKKEAMNIASYNFGKCIELLSPNQKTILNPWNLLMNLVEIKNLYPCVNEQESKLLSYRNLDN